MKTWGGGGEHGRKRKTGREGRERGKRKTWGGEGPKKGRTWGGGQWVEEDTRRRRLPRGRGHGEEKDIGKGGHGEKEEGAGTQA